MIMMRRSFSIAINAKKRVLIAVANGSEEIETVTVMDTLVRSGANVVIASVEDTVSVRCSRGLHITADTIIHNCQSTRYDMVVLPGGMPGALTLAGCPILKQILLSHTNRGIPIGAICAAPAVVLATHGLLDGRWATCYPGPSFRGKIEKFVDKKVVIDGHIITSQGPATAMPFALSLVNILYGAERAERVATEMLWDGFSNN